ncbi:MAG: ribonuclease J [Anaeroplasmataceae bacterium]
MSKINILALGGLQENGKNLYVIEVDEQIFILDAGIKYPTSELYGVDAIVPDITYLIERKDRIKGLYLTNGHIDHIGCAGEIISKIKTKIYASKFTIALVKDMFNEDGIVYNEEDLVEVTGSTKIPYGDVSVKFFDVAHNIPGCLGVCINTPDGNIVYTSDYSFDQNARANYQKMYMHLAHYSKEGVLALLCESLGANNAETRGTILEFKQRVNNVFTNAPGRIVISLFSTDLQRIQQIINISLTFNRKVAIIGRKTQKMVNQAINLGYLRIPEESLVNLRYIDDKNYNNDKDLVVLVTGERHEPYFMLQRMSKKIDRLIRLEENDTVLILTVPYLGTEKMAARTLDMLYKVTTKVKVFGANLLPAPFATREEIKAMINILKPKYIFPVIGEYRHQYAFVIVADCLEFNTDNIIILDNGDVASIENKKYIGITSSATIGEVMIDGRAVGNVGDVVMRDRELLAEDGVIMIIANINPRSKRVISGPELVSKGFNFTVEGVDLKKEVQIAFEKVSINHLVNKFINWSEYKQELKNEISRVLYKYIRRNPIVIPVLISTDVDGINQKKALSLKAKAEEK